jgi:hypothetical protein
LRRPSCAECSSPAVPEPMCRKPGGRRGERSSGRPLGVPGYCLRVSLSWRPASNPRRSEWTSPPVSEHRLVAHVRPALRRAVLRANTGVAIDIPPQSPTSALDPHAGTRVDGCRPYQRERSVCGGWADEKATAHHRNRRRRTAARALRRGLWDGSRLMLPLAAALSLDHLSAALRAG